MHLGLRNPSSGEQLRPTQEAWKHPGRRAPSRQCPQVRYPRLAGLLPDAQSFRREPRTGCGPRCRSPAPERGEVAAPAACTVPARLPGARSASARTAPPRPPSCADATRPRPLARSLPPRRGLRPMGPLRRCVWTGTRAGQKGVSAERRVRSAWCAPSWLFFRRSPAPRAGVHLAPGALSTATAQSLGSWRPPLVSEMDKAPKASRTGSPSVLLTWTRGLNRSCLASSDLFTLSTESF